MKVFLAKMPDHLKSKNSLKNRTLKQMIGESKGQMSKNKLYVLNECDLFLNIFYLSRKAMGTAIPTVF